MRVEMMGTVRGETTKAVLRRAENARIDLNSGPLGARRSI